MQILQMPEARKMLEAYQDGYITMRELREELEWYGDEKMDQETERLIVERARVPVTESLREYA